MDNYLHGVQPQLIDSANRSIVEAVFRIPVSQVSCKAHINDMWLPHIKSFVIFIDGVRHVWHHSDVPSCPSCIFCIRQILFLAMNSPRFFVLLEPFEIALRKTPILSRHNVMPNRVDSQTMLRPFVLVRTFVTHSLPPPPFTFPANLILSLHHNPNLFEEGFRHLYSFRVFRA